MVMSLWPTFLTHPVGVRAIVALALVSFFVDWIPLSPTESDADKLSYLQSKSNLTIHRRKNEI